MPHRPADQRSSRLRRAASFLGALFVALIAGLGFGLGAAGPAYAADGDVIASMQIDYTVTAEGVLQVKETIDYRFGASGRHGIFRDLITRQSYPDDDSKDQIYDISNIAVSSPTGANTDVSKQTETTSGDDRGRFIRLQIGSANETVASTETYVISYEVRGALRHFSDHSELYWNATGVGWEAGILNVTVNVTVPEGVTQTACFAGDTGSKNPCTSASMQGGTGVFTQDQLEPGSQLTIVAGITAGVVSPDTPIVVDAPSLLERAGVSTPALVGAGAVTVLAPVAAAVYARTGNKDQRFVGPPGTFPSASGSAPTVKDTLSVKQLPVAFAPPRIAPAAGGYLIDATINTVETSATLIDLAVRGGFRIIDQDDEKLVQLVDRSKAVAPHELALMQGLFPSGDPGETVPLKRGKVGDKKMYKAHTAHRDALQNMARTAGWYIRPPSANRTKAGLSSAKNIFIGVIIIGFVAFHGTTFAALSLPLFVKVAAIAVPVIAVVIGLFVWRRTAGRGTRSGVGRALTDQVEGFRTYLATAEANQLRFEEGEDIFSRYLPWAIALEMAERWQKLCAQLVAEGRIPEQTGGWYVGPNIYYSSFFYGGMADSMASAFSAPPTPASSGGGSSSGFGGGGFSGGGGGGGGGGSW